MHFKHHLFGKFRPVMLLFALSLAIYSCSTSSKVQVSVHSDDQYPIVQITHPDGLLLTIQPVDPLTGSIGLELDTVVTWITGQPVQLQGENGELYTWEVEKVGKVEMEVIKENKDLNFNLSLDNDAGKLPRRWFLNLAAMEDEYFTGIFERVVDGFQGNSWTKGIQTALNLRGENVEMKIKPTVSAYAPFYVSSNHYGLYVKGTWPGVFDFCKQDSNTVQIAFEGPDMAFKIYAGSTPMEIVQRHAIDTGPSFVPPDWVFGPWRWRDEHFNPKKYYDSTEVKAPFNTDLVEDVLMMSAYDIPMTAYWIDRPWAPGSRGFDDYEFDLTRFPQPEKMIEWLNSKNVELLIWIAPFVMGNMADYAEENNYFLQSKPRGNARQVLMDFTNPAAVKWWGENGPGKLAHMGIKGFKLDRADGEKLRDDLDLFTFAGTTYRQNYNDYPVQYVRAAFDAVKPILGNDFILFPRAQYTGSAKYGGLWAGDTNGRPEGLRSVIIGVQRCAIMGYPVWGSDTGGYWGDFSHETAKRWLGFSCFTPLMEVGPTNNRGFWNNPQEPYYDTELIATWRLYSKIRMKLSSYIHTLAQSASKDGTPIVRPLFLCYPQQEEAWRDWQTFMLGPDILVSAIWESGRTIHNLYLPADESWVDAWNTDVEYTGGKYIEVETPAYKIPIFIRKGAKIDLGDLNELYQNSLQRAEQKPDLAELEKKEGWR